MTGHRQNVNKGHEAPAQKQQQNNPDLSISDIAALIARLEKNFSDKLERVESSFNATLEDITAEYLQTCAASLKPLQIENEKLRQDFQVYKQESDRKIKELEKSIEFVSRKYDHVISQPDFTEKVADTETRVDKIEGKNKYQKQRSRKYNLLLFGLFERIPWCESGETEDDDTWETVLRFFKDELKLKDEEIPHIIISYFYSY